MSRLIDADALIKAWCKKRNINEGDCGAVFVGYSEIPRLIDEQPTIVEFEGDINKVIVKGEEYHRIVRCKDCKHGSPNGKYGCTCYHYTLYKTHEMKPEDFCSRAERRSDDAD